MTADWSRRVSLIEIDVRWASGSTESMPVRSENREDWDSDIQPGACYHLWNAEGELIYVGSTVDARTRLLAHSCKPWWSEVVRAEIVWYPNQVDARTAESRVLEGGPLKHCRQLPWMRYGEGYVPPIPSQRDGSAVPDGDPLLTVAEVAARLGIGRKTWNSYVSRGQAPKADDPDADRPVNKRMPRWLASTIDRYAEDRPGTGWAKGVPKVRAGQSRPRADLAEETQT